MKDEVNRATFRGLNAHTHLGFKHCSFVIERELLDSCQVNAQASVRIRCYYCFCVCVKVNEGSLCALDLVRCSTALYCVCVCAGFLVHC